MNIFVTSNDPIECAAFLDDKRVNKMLLESVQLLSTVMHLSGLKGPYRVTHKNHPCVLWILESQQNYKWLYDHALALYNQYKLRFNKHTHGCYEALLKCEHGYTNLPNITITPFVNCTPNKEIKNIYEAYNKTLQDKWKCDKLTPTRYGVPLC